MSFQINCTESGVITYPLHNHSEYEIIYYLLGEGCLKTEREEIPYEPGTIIIVPPKLMHGSVSGGGFRNISISGNFGSIFTGKDPIVLHDNPQGEGRVLAELIYKNRFGSQNFLKSLCESYSLFLMANLKFENNLDGAISRVISEIESNAFDLHFDLKATLLKTGYAEDYIRNQFKRKTGKTPTRFLTEIQIKRACYFIEIYQDSRSLAQIAELCGFADYIYFSKRFKQITGFSPSEYKKRT